MNTKDAAPGAFAWRDYPDQDSVDAARNDWRVIIAEERHHENP